MARYGLAHNVMSTTNGAASEMTQALRSFGGDDMGAGIRKLWHSGWNRGFMHGGLCVGAGIIVATCINKFVRYRREKEFLNSIASLKETPNTQTCTNGESITNTCEDA